MAVLKMSLHRWWILAVVIGLVVPLAMAVPTASADNHEFDISIYHGINGRSLGLSKDLPVDIYVNGDLAIPGVEFKDRIETSLPAGEYTFAVNLAGTDTTVMSFGPAEIPAGADVSVHAKLGAKKAPTLKVKVR
jgi:hypothetical protein